MSNWGQMGLQEASTPLMEQLILFHDHAMVMLILILTLVTFVTFTLLMEKYSCRFILESKTIETMWTMLPVFILVILAFPSLRLLYMLDEISQPTLSMKAIGHQWYWSYEYSDFKNLKFDAFMLNDNQINMGEYRLLETNNHVVVPMNSSVRLLVTSEDVIHCWTIPSLGVKADAIPGRLNQLNFMILRPGVFYGQCSEICGANHSFMPIALEATNMPTFLAWINPKHLTQV
uniref:Cytochrome c oxidase subunit 2 n=1 Tax=Chaetoderma nitidulum TaxID=256131 RepID=D3G6C7_CHANT|nr:cytochrome c oxidase subunit II [Chaetoderma nitidulum]ABM69275.1 cytochrome c oxidase subunit 2 [Chaetoderma nitidulum]